MNIDAEDVDLGTVMLSRGSTVRVKVLVPNDQTPPRIYASAWTQRPFPYARYINFSGQAEVLLRGLGKGTFRVRAHPMNGGKAHVDEEVTADGENEVLVTLDLR